MFAVPPYYLSSSGTLDYTAGYTISRPDTTTFNCEIPLGSSIESTMEWCNRVGVKHSWSEFNDPIYDVSGFYWLHYDGMRDLKRVVPSASTPYQINGDCTLGSGFYNRYREIVKFMGDNTLQRWTLSGDCWPNMGDSNTWTDIQNLNTKTKLEKTHYHQHIYKKTQVQPVFFGGTYYKQIYVHKYTTPGQTGLSGWAGPYYDYNVAVSNISGLWHNNGYVYNTNFARNFQFIGEDSSYGFGATPTYYYSNGIDPGSVNTYTHFIGPSGGGAYPSGFYPPYVREIVNGNNLIGFSEFKTAAKTRIDSYSAPSGYYSSTAYSATLNINLENSFGVAFFPYDYNVRPTNFPSYINRKLKHILGIDNSDLYSSVSGTWSDSYTPFSADYYPSGFSLYPLLHTDFLGCTSSWGGNFRVGFGFLNMSGVQMDGISLQDYYGGFGGFLADLVAIKIRDSDYMTVASFSITEPMNSGHTWQIHPSLDDRTLVQKTGPKTDVTWTNTIYDEWSLGNNMLFIAIWSDPFEGGDIDYTPLDPAVLDTSVPITTNYSLPSASEAIERSKRGELMRIVPRRVADSGIQIGQGPSQNQIELSRIISDLKWY